MGWRGAGGNAAATIAATIWFSGMLLAIVGAMEWILGNFFPFIVFMGYESHFLVLGTTFMPFYNAVGAYNTGYSASNRDLVLSMKLYGKKSVHMGAPGVSEYLDIWVPR